MEYKLEETLEARDLRWNRRIDCARRLGEGCVITLTICLPQSYRISAEMETLFANMAAAVQAHLAQAGIPLTPVDGLCGADGPAAFWTTPRNAALVKMACVEAEETLAAGRMMDIDVMGGDEHALSRSDVALPLRRCFLCQQPAAVCVVGRAHGKGELEECIEGFLRLARQYYSWLT